MDLPDLQTFARRPRDALMWVPRALDIARIRAALAVAGPRVVDVGAGTGLLARLLDVDIDVCDPAPARVRYHDMRIASAGDLTGTYDAAIVSWMEAGQDYRAACARLAPVVVNCFDAEGGCGVMGQVDLASFGFVDAVSWRTASFEDAAYAIDHRGALRRKGHPGNVVAILTREPSLVPALQNAVEAAEAGTRLPWEVEMNKLDL